MRINSISGILLCLVCLTVAAQDIQDDFADGLQGWGNWKAKAAIVQFQHDAQSGRSAPGSLTLILGPKNPEQSSACFTKHLAVQPGKTYTALVYVRTEGLAEPASLSIGLQGQDAKKSFLGTQVLSGKVENSQIAPGEWKRIVYTVRVPETGRWENAAFLLCTLAVKGSTEGQAWFDDFMFFEN
ncbi:MAG: hypothetical protein PHG44_10040 [Lentisphaeria bacterium]|nr:hypothetical protein [Lentisphaeria bacterium]MDY0177603.1 hypothetical protein [Lentisphaeria bacterium]